MVKIAFDAPKQFQIHNWLNPSSQSKVNNLPFQSAGPIYTQQQIMRGALANQGFNNLKQSVGMGPQRGLLSQRQGGPSQQSGMYNVFQGGNNKSLSDSSIFQQAQQQQLQASQLSAQNALSQQEFMNNFYEQSTLGDSPNQQQGFAPPQGLAAQPSQQVMMQSNLQNAVLGNQPGAAQGQPAQQRTLAPGIYGYAGAGGGVTSI